MFVIKNTKRDYNCYLTENNTWKGLLEAKIFKTKEEAEQSLLEDGIILSWEDVVHPKK